MITVLQDTSDIDDKDLIAKKTKYYLKWLTSQRNQYRSHVNRFKMKKRATHNMNISRWFVELVNNIKKNVYNMKKRASNSCNGKTRHSAGQEPSLPIYNGLSIQEVTRSKKLI